MSGHWSVRIHRLTSVYHDELGQGCCWVYLPGALTSARASQVYAFLWTAANHWENAMWPFLPKSRVQRWQLGRGRICRRRSAGAPRSQPCPFEYSKRFVCTCFDNFGLGDPYVSCYGKAWHRSEYVRSPMPSADSRDGESVRSTPAQVNRRLRLHLRFHNEYVVRSRHNNSRFLPAQVA